MTMASFRNALKILRAIDQHELVEARVTDMNHNATYVTFRLNPFQWFMRATDEDAEKVWQIIERRQA